MTNTIDPPPPSLPSAPARPNLAADEQTGLTSARLLEILREEFGWIQPRVILLTLALNVLPPYAGGRLRAQALRLAGFSIGKGSVVWGTPHIHGIGDVKSRLAIGERCAINVGCHLDLNDTITIGNNVGLGHEVMIITASHKVGRAVRRSGVTFTAPVTIGDGAWIGARSILFPGVTVGAGAVVSAGAVVNKDVPPNALVAGAPAQIIVPRLPGS